METRLGKGDLDMRYLINPLGFTDAETTKVSNLAERIAEDPSACAHTADGKKLATFFYELSARTWISFEPAICSARRDGRTSYAS